MLILRYPLCSKSEGYPSYAWYYGNSLEPTPSCAFTKEAIPLPGGGGVSGRYLCFSRTGQDFSVLIRTQGWDSVLVTFTVNKSSQRRSKVDKINTIKAIISFFLIFSVSQPLPWFFGSLILSIRVPVYLSKTSHCFQSRRRVLKTRGPPSELQNQIYKVLEPFCLSARCMRFLNLFTASCINS